MCSNSHVRCRHPRAPPSRTIALRTWRGEVKYQNTRSPSFNSTTLELSPPPSSNYPVTEISVELNCTHCILTIPRHEHALTLTCTRTTRSPVPHPHPHHVGWPLADHTLRF